MPCHDGYVEQEIGNLTEMLCTLCKALEKENLSHLMPEDIVAWWERHKERDRRRDEYEAAKEETRRIAAEAGRRDALRGFI